MPDFVVRRKHSELQSTQMVPQAIGAAHSECIDLWERYATELAADESDGIASLLLRNRAKIDPAKMRLPILFYIVRAPRSAEERPVIAHLFAPWANELGLQVSCFPLHAEVQLPPAAAPTNILAAAFELQRSWRESVSDALRCVFPCELPKSEPARDDSGASAPTVSKTDDGQTDELVTEERQSGAADQGPSTSEDMLPTDGPDAPADADRQEVNKFKMKYLRMRKAHPQRSLGDKKARPNRHAKAVKSRVHGVCPDAAGQSTRKPASQKGVYFGDIKANQEMLQTQLGETVSNPDALLDLLRRIELKLDIDYCQYPTTTDYTRVYIFPGDVDGLGNTG